jgi:superfamily II DNA or RNA helicase
VAKLLLPVRTPEKAYVDRMLWLPKLGVRQQAITNALEFWDVQDRAPTCVRLWEDSPNHIGVPREFLKVGDYPSYPFTFVDSAPRSFPRSGITTGISLRNDKQREAYAAMQANPNGILNLGCGKGKTVLALKRLAELGCPGLVVVHNTYLFDQWQKRIEEHLQLPAGEKIGIIQGPEFDWERPIAIAMIHTLAQRAKEGKLPTAFGRHFGLGIYDEVHHLAARLFSQTAHVLSGHRLGLTATPRRLDGLEYIYLFHLGPVFYTDTEQDLIPRTYFQLTPTKLDLSDKNDDVRDKTGELNIPKMRSAIGNDAEANRFRWQCIMEAANQGRKILALSHSRDQLLALHEMTPGSALIINDTPQEERAALVKKSQVTYSIAKLGVEGLDDSMLDTLFFLTPFSSEVDLEQASGRIGSRDPMAKKGHPVMIVFDDIHIPPFHHMCRALKKKLNEWSYLFWVLPAPDLTR